MDSGIFRTSSIKENTKQLDRLRGLIEQIRPELVFEYGAGRSTIAMGEALRGIGVLISMEPSVWFYNLLKPHIEDLPVELVLCDMTRMKDGDKEYLRHSPHPAYQYQPDMIFIDGPDLGLYRGLPIDLLYIDLKPSTLILLDKRTAVAELMIDYGFEWIFEEESQLYQLKKVPGMRHDPPAWGN